MKINYPTWTLHRQTTEALWVCPSCGKAQWSTPKLPAHCNCQGRKGGFVKCRPATEEETAEGRKNLEVICQPVVVPPAPPPPKPKKLRKGEKPLFVLKFVGGPYDQQYYSGKPEHWWKGVDRETAERLDHTKVRKVQGHLKRHKIEQATVVEPA